MGGARSSDPYDGLSKNLSIAGSVTIFLLGLSVVTACMHALKDDGFQALSNVIEVDTAWSAEPELSYSLDKALYAALTVGAVAMLASVVGCAGAHLNVHALICSYFLGALVLFTWFLLSVISLSNFENSVQVIAARQVTEMCGINQYYNYKAQLGCDAEMGTFTVADFPKAATACGAVCKEKAGQLTKMGGCKTLKTLCHTFDYETVGTGQCLANDVAPKKWSLGTSQSVEECQKVCNQNVVCQGFSHDGKACYFHAEKMPAGYSRFNASYVSPAFGTPLNTTDGDAAYSCSAKELPAVINKSSAMVNKLILVLGVAIGVVFLTMACTCSHLFTTATRRKGNKGGMKVLQRFLCPWCIPSVGKRKFDDFDRVSDSDSSSSEDSDGRGLCA